MPGKSSRSTKTSQKKLLVAAPQLPETYNKLLADYVDLLRDDPTNPYEFSIKQRILGYFNIKGQLDYARSSQINDFIKTPDALAQELPAAKEMLKKLERFDDQSIRAFMKMNAMNLIRLRRRSIRNQISPSLAIMASIIGLLIDLQDMLAVSIKDSFAWLSRFNISLLVQVIIILIIALALVIARINWMFTTPRIGLVDAFGDILQIVIAHRNIKE
jgi:hypothetical protein